MQLLAILTAPEVEQRAVDAVLVETRRQFAADADIAALEAECPGTIDVMIAAANAPPSSQDEANMRAYDEGYLALLRREMPAAQAADAAAFFGSELGQRFLLGVSGAMTFGNSIASAIDSEDGSVPRNAFDQDREDAALAATNELSAADQFEATMLIGSSDWGKTIERIRPQLTALQYEFVNTQLTPEEDAAVDQRLDDALEAHLADCPLQDLSE